MAKYTIPKQDDMQFDHTKPLACKGRVWTDDEIEELLGPDFEIIELLCDDVMYLQKGWDSDESNLPLNRTSTSLVNLRIKGCTLTCEPTECRRR